MSKITSFSIVLLAIITTLVAMPVLAAAQALALDTQAMFAGSASGNWSTPANVTGPNDGSCANMGAVGKHNFVSNFGFTVPGDANISAVRAVIFAGAQSGQSLSIQLITDPSVPTTIGSSNTFNAASVGQGNCANAVPDTVGGTGNLAYWGSPALTPTIVNSTGFGLELAKIQTSEVKVDAVCMEIDYTTVSGLATQQSCTPSPSLFVNKTVAPTTVTSGGQATFTITIDNTGNTDLTTVNVVDDNCTLEGGPNGNGTIPTTLPAGDVWTFTCTVTDLQPPSFTNTVHVTTDQTPTQDKSATVTVVIPPPPTKVVPTMTEWGLILFMMLAGLGSVYYLRRRKKV